MCRLQIQVLTEVCINQEILLEIGNKKKEVKEETKNVNQVSTSKDDDDN